MDEQQEKVEINFGAQLEGMERKLGETIQKVRDAAWEPRDGVLQVVTVKVGWLERIQIALRGGFVMHVGALTENVVGRTRSRESVLVIEPPSWWPRGRWAFWRPESGGVELDARAPK